MKKFTSLLFVIGILELGTFALRATPFFVQLYNADGTPQTNQIYMSFYPKTSTFETYGTSNVIFGGGTILLSPNASGYASNWAYPGVYQCYITNLNRSFLVSLADTTNFNSLSTYVQNLPAFSGLPLSSYGVVTNWLGFAPLTNSAGGVLWALNFQPSTNTLTGITNLIGVIGTIAARGSNDFALNTLAGIVTAQGYTSASNTAAGVLWSLNFQPATNTVAGITNLIGVIGTIASRGSNDFALASSLGTIASRGSNDFALATPAGIVAALGSTPRTNDGYTGTSLVSSSAYIVTNGFGVWITLKTNNAPGPAFTNQPQGSLLTTTNGGFYILSNLVWQAIPL